MQIAAPTPSISGQVVLGGAQESAFLVRPQVVLMLLVQGPHVENY